MIKSVKDLAVEGKRVFLRVDFDVPITPAGGVADDGRMRAALPTILHLVERGARLVLGAHLGCRGAEPAPSIEPVGARLAELLGQDVLLTDEPVGDGARKVVSDLRDGQIALLENLRCHAGEEQNDEPFARALASYADVYVNDAFGAAHLAHASTVGMVRYVPEKCAGLLLDKELGILGKLLGTVERPYLAVLGGARVSDKLGVLESLAGRVDKLLVGGAMANTFLKAQGQKVGRSQVEEGKLAVARSFLKRAEGRLALLLPRDVVVAESTASEHGEVKRLAEIDEQDVIVDIGPETVQAYAAELQRARTIFWNGPLGVCERPPFARGTAQVAAAVAANQRALSVVAGGDSLAAIQQAGVAGRMSLVATGGSASLQFVEGKILPGLAALEG